jgi:hypothetical protein
MKAAGDNRETPEQASAKRERNQWKALTLEEYFQHLTLNVFSGDGVCK